MTVLLFRQTLELILNTHAVQMALPVVGGTRRPEVSHEGETVPLTFPFGSGRGSERCPLSRDVGQQQVGRRRHLRAASNPHASQAGHEDGRTRGRELSRDVINHHWG